MINIFKSKRDKTDIALAYYIGSYSVLYTLEHSLSLNELFKIIKKGTNRNDLLATSRKDFNQRYDYLNTINLTDNSELFPTTQATPIEVMDVVIEYFHVDYKNLQRKQFDVAVNELTLSEAQRLIHIFRKGSVYDSDKADVLSKAGIKIAEHKKISDLKIVDNVLRFDE